MFDDSKRLDKLEAQMSSINDAYSTSVKNLNQHLKIFGDFDTTITKQLTAAITQINENAKAYDKRHSDTLAEIKKLEGVIAKLTARLAKAEADLKKK